MDVLRGIGVLTSKLTIEGLDEERTHTYPKVEFFTRFGRWPNLVEAKEFDKTLEVKPLIWRR